MKIGLCGYGVIGSKVKELTCIKNDFEVVKVFDKPIKKEELKDLYVSDYKDITNDPTIDIVVEAMGGDELPYIIIKDALQNKKSVVTSNKEVVSLHLNEFNELAKNNNVYFMFEASVGGGIPIINTLIQNQLVNNINHIYGIINGTTNYILTKMEEGKSFDEALINAQKNGFAESDPTSDLEGLDMVRKISILSDIAYHTFINVSKVNHKGITKITKEVIDSFNKDGYIIKYICESINKNNNVLLNVEPICIKKDNLLSNIHNEYNCIVLNGDNTGLLSFIGKGAGDFPTSSAIISDMYYILNNNGYKYLNLNNQVNYIDNMNDNEYLVYIEEDKKIIKVNNIEKYNNYFSARIFRG